jgi:hypothetical protein
MNTVLNFFSNGSNKDNVTNLATSYATYKSNLKLSTPALTQGDRFKYYQRKIKKSLAKKAKELSGKEGFEPNLTQESQQLIDDYNYTPAKNAQIKLLQDQYNSTLKAYNILINQINGNVNSYITRTNSSTNQYLGKNIVIDNHFFYVTQQGVAKMYPSLAILEATVGNNGCPNSKAIVITDISWNDMFTKPGNYLPTRPNLLIGTPMTAGQSCGNEGVNVYVNNMINTPQTEYLGCYKDNVDDPLMTFIGGAPPPPSGTLINGDFSQPQLPNNSYIYYNDETSVLGWVFDACLVNNSSAWGFPSGYNQAASIQGLSYCYQWITLDTGTYTLTFSAVGRPNNNDGYFPNNINVFCGTNDDDIQSQPVIYSVTPQSSGWYNYNANITIQTTGPYAIGFYGTINGNNAATAITNVVLTNTGSQFGAGTYTYQMCQQAAINNGSQYFALQNVNPTTSQGYCAISNDQPTITSLGPAEAMNALKPLWSSQTLNQPGNTATLTASGTLSVINSTGQSVFSTPNNSNAPSNYLGCYGDSANRAMGTTVNSSGGTENGNTGPWSWTFDVQECQQAAQSNGFSYFGLQATTGEGTSVCFLSDDFAQTSEYGTANNCTQYSDGNWEGGGYSNAVYNTNGMQGSNYILMLLDSGNMVIQRGTSPSDNQGIIWQTNTTASQANSDYVAANGQGGQNWIADGTTLTAGQFIGSPNGYVALVMEPTGNLVLYTFAMGINCSKMADNHMGGGPGANAIYNIGQFGYTSDMGQLAYIDQNSELHAYPSTNTQFQNSYTQINGIDSPGNNITNFSGSVQQCQTSCNNNNSCAGFAYTGGTCYLKNNSMYPNSQENINSNVNLYVRNEQPAQPPVGVPFQTNNINSIQYQNYVNGGQLGSEYGISTSITPAQQQELNTLQNQLNSISQAITDLTDDFQGGTLNTSSQMTKNVKGVDVYLTELDALNSKIQKYGGENLGINNMIKDSDIVVLQKNYSYLLWSTLAIGTVLVAMNIAK